MRTLISTIAEFCSYVSYDANANFEVLVPFIKEAEDFFIIDLLGKEFYDEFSDAYAASILPEDDENYEALSADNAELLPYVQRCLAYYATLQAIPHLALQFGDMGLRQARANESDAAPKWLQDRLQTQALKNGDLHAEALLKFLEENASDTKYTTWFESAANTRADGTIVYSTTVASLHIDISQSRRLFLRLLPTIKQLEARYIPKLIGQDQYDELKEALIAEAANVTEIPDPLTALAERLARIIAKRALYMRLPYLRVAITQDGLWLQSDTNFEFRSKDYLASKEDIKALRCELLDGELGAIADEFELKQYILDNIDDYPLIKASTVYTSKADPGPTFRPPENSADNKGFYV